MTRLLSATVTSAKTTRTRRRLSSQRNPSLSDGEAMGPINISSSAGFIQNAPANDTHLCRVSKASRLAFNLVFLMGSMDESMTGLAQGNQIIRTLPASLSRLDMMDIQDAIFRLALAPLTRMTISRQNILTDIPEAELWTFLVRLALYLRVLYLLNIKLRHLNRQTTNGQEAMNQADRFHLALNFVLNRRCQPALRFVSVQEFCLAIACLPLSSRTTKLPPRGKQFLNIASRLHFSLKEHFLLSGSRDTNMVCSRVNP